MIKVIKNDHSDENDSKKIKMIQNAQELIIYEHGLFWVCFGHLLGTIKIKSPHNHFLEKDEP